MRIGPVFVSGHTGRRGAHTTWSSIPGDPRKDHAPMLSPKTAGIR